MHQINCFIILWSTPIVENIIIVPLLPPSNYSFLYFLCSWYPSLCLKTRVKQPVGLCIHRTLQSINSLHLKLRLHRSESEQSFVSISTRAHSILTNKHLSFNYLSYHFSVDLQCLLPVETWQTTVKIKSIWCGVDCENQWDGYLYQRRAPSLGKLLFIVISHINPLLESENKGN